MVTRETFEEWLIHTHALYQLAFEKFYIVEKDDDLDTMLFDAMKNRDCALQELREFVKTFFKDTYPEMVREVLTQLDSKNSNLNTSLASAFYLYLQSMGSWKPSKFLSSFSISFGKHPDDSTNLYRKLLKQFQHHSFGYPCGIKLEEIEIERWQELLQHWRVYLETDISNDGFDSHTIEKRLKDLIATVACIQVLCRA